MYCYIYLILLHIGETFCFISFVSVMGFSLILLFSNFFFRMPMTILYVLLFTMDTTSSHLHIPALR